MTMGQIAALPIDLVAARDCVLFIWMSWPMLEQALHVIDRWGFKYKTCGFAWVKANGVEVKIGTGYWFRVDHELLLIGEVRIGARLHSDVRQAIIEPPREHRAGLRARAQAPRQGPYLDCSRSTRAVGIRAVRGRQIDEAAVINRNESGKRIELRRTPKQFESLASKLSPMSSKSVRG
jgi:hypothetical protein